MTKQQYQKEQRKVMAEAQKAGYTVQEIDKAKDIAKIMGRGYINNIMLERAREELKYGK